MRIAVIGTGNIGGTIGRACARHGHTVVFGSRKPRSDDAAGDSGATVADVPGALLDAEVVVLALPGSAVAEFVREHADSIGDILVVDAANNFGGDGPANSYDAIIATVPDARYARAFNSLGFENLADPNFGDTNADMFFSAGEADRGTVEALIKAVGLRPVYTGEGAHDVVDGVGSLWFALAIGQKRGRHLAFKVLEGSGS
ncbi:MAG: NAD(P)-binding domain-containing protein [Acidimicrobiales bacterium]